MNELTVGSILQNALKIGLKNAPSLVGAVILWALTVWIPYLNVGTTIGLIGIVAKMGRGEVISPTEIFDKQYRKMMGEFFLVRIFLSMGVTIGMIFVYIPGVVIAIAWSLAPLLVLDKGVNPMEALKISNDRTYGKKWTIFGSQFLLGVAGFIALIILTLPFILIGGAIGGAVATLFGLVSALIFLLVGYIILKAAMMGINAYVYHTLTADLPADGYRVA